MKKILTSTAIIAFVMLSLSKHLFSQSGQKFASNGNILSTGEFLGSTNLFPLVIKTNNKEWMRITETGNVGIGIIAPTDKLHVAGTARMLNAKVDADLTALNIITQKLNAAVSAVIGDLTLSNGSILSSSGNISFGSNNLSTTGNISGANITASGTLQGQSLSVSGNAVISGTMDAHTILQNGNPIQQTQWTTSGSNISYTNGNVGIGTNKPTETLEVEGRVRISSTAPTSTVINTPPSPPQQRSIIIDGGVDEITATSGTLTFPNTNLVTTGSISAQQINIGSGELNFGGKGGEVVKVDRSRIEFSSPSISQSKLMVGTMDSASGKQEICTHDGDLRLQSHIGLTNTIINEGNLGRVGIGTNNPTEKLSVAGDVGVSGNFRLSNLSGTGDRTVLVDGNGNLKTGGPTTQSITDPWVFGGNDITADPAAFLGTTNAADLVFKTDNIEQMRITSSGHVPKPDHPGNVGIGTNDPQKKLHVVTTHTVSGTSGVGTHEGIRLEDQIFDSDFNTTTINAWDVQPLNGSNFAIRKPGQNPVMTLYNNGSADIGSTDPAARLKVSGNGFFSGNVGIGTSTPQQKLDVSGTINATQYFKNGQPLIASQWISAGNDIYYNTGNVGVGTTAPLEKFSVNGNIRIGPDPPTPYPASSYYVLISDKGIESANTIGKSATLNLNSNGNGVSIGSQANSSALFVNGYILATGDATIKGKVIIGNATGISGTHNDYQLAVAGKIVSKSTYVTISNWQDKVFADDYLPLPLERVEEYYTTNKHLPDYPAEKEIIDNGLDLGSIATLQQKSIEEIMLYLVDMKKEMNTLKEKNATLENEIQKLKTK